MAGPAAALVAFGALAGTGPWGDQAAIQLATDRAARFTQLVGPYSRFGWSHPGPLWFYLLAGPYRLFGGTGRALVAATLVVTGVAALLTVGVASRLGGRRAGRWLGVVLLAELAALGPVTLAEVWNPVAIIVPTTLYLVCCAGLAAGRWWMLPWAAGVGSFLVQTDVSTGVVVAGVGAAAVGAAAVRSRAGAGRPVLVALAVAGLLWVAPVVQQLTGSPGNLGRLVSFFRSGSGGHPVGAAARAVAGALWPPFSGRFGSPPTAPVAGAVLVVALLAAAGVALAGVRRGRTLGAALGAGGGLAVVLGVVSVTRATGQLYGYLTEWLSAADVAVVAGLLLVVSGAGRPAGRRRAGAALGLAGLALVGLAAADRPGPLPGGAEVDTLFSAARPGLPRAGPAGGAVPVEVAVATPDRWPWAAGLLVDLAHAGYRPVAQPSWLFLFGTQLAYQGRPPVTVTVWRPGAGPRPPGRQVAQVGATALLVSSSGSGGTSR